MPPEEAGALEARMKVRESAIRPTATARSFGLEATRDALGLTSTPLFGCLRG
jgi:hypothetical protein